MITEDFEHGYAAFGVLQIILVDVLFEYVQRGCLLNVGGYFLPDFSTEITYVSVCQTEVHSRNDK